MLYYDAETRLKKLHKVLVGFALVLASSIITAVAINTAGHAGDIKEGTPPSVEEDIPFSAEEDTPFSVEEDTLPNIKESTPPSAAKTELYTVLSVTDGDTIRIDYNGTNTPLRIIGIDTPETVDQRTTVQCFGRESSDYLKTKLTGKQVSIESDPTQSDRDKYNRLLRYVYLDGEDVGLSIIANGYGHEYTYNIPYQKQSEYKKAEKSAESNNLGLWSPSTCNGNTSKQATTTSEQTAEPTSTPTPAPAPTPITSTPAPETTQCLIKGNINNKGERIYHLPGQQYYDDTIITPAKGERYFCTEAEAQAAGWRRAKV